MSGGSFADKKFIEIKGRKMAYIDEGKGAPIVFQHGNPTSSYLWRKVMPACVELGPANRLRPDRHGRFRKAPELGA